MKTLIVVILTVVIVAGILYFVPADKQSTDLFARAQSYCTQENVAGVEISREAGYIKVISSLLGGGATYYPESGGQPAHCPVVGPDAVTDECAQLMEVTDWEVVCEADGQPAIGEITASSEEAMNEVTVIRPLSNDIVTLPLVVRGEMPGYWFFEANTHATLEDTNGNELAEPAILTAQGEWMTEDLVSFEGTFSVNGEIEAGRGYVVIHKANPSGLPENDAWVKIPVRFGGMINSGREAIPWQQAVSLIKNCDVEMITQLHSREVQLKLSDGREVSTTEPAIDEVFRVYDSVRDKCPAIPVATE